MIESGPSAVEYHLRILGRLQGWPIAAVCLGLVAALAGYVALHSFLIVITETSALLIGDVYAFYYTDYFSYLDGYYSLWQLLQYHNEHLILTTRLVLFVDTIWFGASGKFAIMVSYVLVFVTSLMMAYLAATPNKWERTALAFVFLGLGCSVIQLDNLSLPFQVQFFFVHAFALAALIALWRGLQGRRWWYVLACACDFGAAFSLGTGVLLGGACLALAVWIRRMDRWLAIFLTFHLLLVFLYVWIVVIPYVWVFVVPVIPVFSSPAALFVYFLTFLGNFAAAWPKWALPAGAVIAVACAGIFSWLTWRALFRGLRCGEEAVIAAFAVFVILEAITASIGRAKFGVDQALSLRYTTCTLLLVAALFAFVWRAAPQVLSRVTALVALSATLVAANNAGFENGWRARNRAMDAIIAEINDGNVSADAAAYLFVPRPILEAIITRFRKLHLGPFRGTN
jgi:hypothetical protein